MLSCVTRSLGKDYKVLEGSTIFPHGRVVARGRQPSVGYRGAEGFLSAPEPGHRLWVFMTSEPAIEGIPRPPFGDDTARSQCVCEGKKVWHYARETVNLLGRLNFMFK